MLTNIELLLLSAALGMDLFSVAVPIGMNKLKIQFILKASVVFAAFHIIMMLGGYYAGYWLGIFVEHVGIYHINLPTLLVADLAKMIGGIVLVALGAHMLFEQDQHLVCAGSLSGSTLVVLGISVSLDALAAGFSMGMIDINLIKFSLILGLTIFIISGVGLTIGRGIGRFIGDKAQKTGGFVLILLGLNILWLALK